MRAALLVLVVALQLLACPFSVVDEFDTFVVPRDSIDLSSHRFVLVPTTAQDELRYPDSVRVLIDSLVQARLQDAGLDVVPSAEYAAIWERLTQEAKGFYDPYTGERDEPEYQAAVRQLYRELNEQFTPFGFLYPELWVVEAPMRGTLAVWDGTAERVYPIPNGLEWVNALTFAVVIEDTTGAELFVNGHGLEVIEELDTGTREMAFKSAILGDRERIVDAVRATLEPLVSSRQQTASRQ